MYDTPRLYLVLHLLMGALCAVAPLWVAVLFLLYQAAQLVLMRRFFLFSLEVREGNSLPYTLYKVAQFFAGYGAAAMALRLLPLPVAAAEEKAA